MRFFKLQKMAIKMNVVVVFDTEQNAQPELICTGIKPTTYIECK